MGKLLADAKANLTEAEANPKSSKMLIAELQKTIEDLQRQKSQNSWYKRTIIFTNED
jgi:chromosome segregation ATPase